MLCIQSLLILVILKTRWGLVPERSRGVGAESGTLAGGVGGLNECVTLEAGRRMGSSCWSSVGAGARWFA